MTIKLQGIYGEQPAKHVKDLRVGDIIQWNFGYTSTVVELIPSKTGKMILCKLLENGIIWCCSWIWCLGSMDGNCIG